MAQLFLSKLLFVSLRLILSLFCPPDAVARQRRTRCRRRQRQRKTCRRRRRGQGRTHSRRRQRKRKRRKQGGALCRRRRWQGRTHLAQRRQRMAPDRRRRRLHGAGSGAATAAGKLGVLARPVAAGVRSRRAGLHSLRVARLRQKGAVARLLQAVLLEKETNGRNAKCLPPVFFCASLAHVLR